MTYEFDYEEEDGGDDGDCYWCGGDGWVECPNWLECTKYHNANGECRCASCGGSGNGKDMSIW